MGNWFKTALLLSALSLLMLFVGDVLGGRNGLVLALGFAIATNFFSYFFSDKLALMMNRAQPVTREELPRVFRIVENLTQRVGLPMPRIYVIPTDSANAFATGRNPQHAAVAVTQGILDLLDDEELEGVIAHELGHVRNRDILTSSIAATLAAAITFMARMAYYAEIFGFGGGSRDDRDRGGGALSALAMMILAPFAAMLIQLAVSRSREYEADATGAHFTGNPFALARALKKLETSSQRTPMAVSPSTAHLFIVQPFLRMSGIDFSGLFSTHPPIARRIERLTGRPEEFI